MSDSSVRDLAAQVVMRLRSFIDALTASSRRVWWTSFVIAALLAGMWGLANPPFAGPDEPAHVIRAHALAHGQITGDEPSGRIRRDLRRAGVTQRVLVVKAPEIYQSAADSLCFAFKAEVNASCLVFSGPTKDIGIAIYTARHPPAYYAVVGAVSWLHRPGSGTVYLMRFLGALITGAFVATAITALRRSAAPTLLAAGLLLALTPMVLFISGIVNPSAVEIAASLAFWVAGLVLVAGSHERVDNRLVTAVGLAGCVLAVSRQLGPLWLGLIALTMLGIANRRRLVELSRSNWARLWGSLIAVSAIGQVAWDVFVKPLEVTPLGQKQNIETSEILRATFGATLNRVREMIGIFGWLDAPAPALTWISWIAAVGFIFLLAVMWARRRDIAVLIGLVAATIVVPVLIESSQYGTAGSPLWQGRYTLPLAFGIPLLAAFVLGSTEGGRKFPARRLLHAVGVVVMVAHVLAFAQNLRRYTVGYDGEVQYWKHAQWSPPVSPLLLTIGFTIAMIGFVAVVFAATRNGAEPAASSGAVETQEATDRQADAAIPTPTG
jgi:Predicted membrane protein (DUF2142)